MTWNQSTKISRTGTRYPVGHFPQEGTSGRGLFPLLRPVLHGALFFQSGGVP